MREFCEFKEAKDSLGCRLGPETSQKERKRKDLNVMKSA